MFMVMVVERMIVEEDDDGGDMLVFGRILPLGELYVKAPPTKRRSNLMANLANQAKWDHLSWKQCINTRHKDVEIKVMASNLRLDDAIISVDIYINL